MWFLEGKKKDKMFTPPPHFSLTGALSYQVSVAGSLTDSQGPADVDHIWSAPLPHIHFPLECGQLFTATSEPHTCRPCTSCLLWPLLFVFFPADKSLPSPVSIQSFLSLEVSTSLPPLRSLSRMFLTFSASSDLVLCGSVWLSHIVFKF